MPDVLCSAGLRYNNLKIGDRRAPKLCLALDWKL